MILDLYECNQASISTEGSIKRYAREICDVIDMKAYGEPVIEHFATHSHDAAGFTLLQMIETSNICAHFAENLGQVYIDIFSCKAFDNEIAAEVCAKYFEPSHIERQALTRGAFPRLLEQAV